MRASSGDLQSPLDVLLALDVAQVDGGWRFGVQVDLVAVNLELDVAVEMRHQICQILNGDDSQAGDEGGLAGVRFGEKEGGDLFLARHRRHGEHAADVAGAAVEGEFADQQRAVQRIGGYLLGGGQDAHGDGQVIDGAGLADVGGRQVDGQSLAGKVEAAVDDGGPHPLAGFLHGRVREPDDGQTKEPARGVDLDVDRGRVKPKNRATGDFG